MTLCLLLLSECEMPKFVFLLIWEERVIRVGLVKELEWGGKVEEEQKKRKGRFPFKG